MYDLTAQLGGEDEKMSTVKKIQTAVTMCMIGLAVSVCNFLLAIHPTSGVTIIFELLLLACSIVSFIGALYFARCIVRYVLEYMADLKNAEPYK